MSIKKKIICILADFDGTLIFNREANILSYQQAFNEVGLPFNRSIYLAHYGHRFPELIAGIAPGATEEQQSQIRSLKAQYYKKNIGLIRLNEPLVQFLRSMKQNMRIGLSTTASQHNAKFVLQHFGLIELFDSIVYGEDVTHSKPNPECYALNMQRLNVTPEQVLIFEDSAIGLEAALASGAQVIHIKEE